MLLVDAVGYPTYWCVVKQTVTLFITPRFPTHQRHTTAGPAPLYLRTCTYTYTHTMHRRERATGVPVPSWRGLLACVLFLRTFFSAVHG